MIRQFFKMLYGLKDRERLDIVPRVYSMDYDPRTVNYDEARVMAASHARSPRNVELLMHQHKVGSVDDLLELLPDRQRKVYPRARLRRWWIRFRGLFPYEPVVRPALRQMNLEDHGTLIRRTVWKENNRAPP